MAEEGIRGRGSASNPANRFRELHYEPDPGTAETRPATTFIADASASLIVYNDSPDIPFDAGINPYRGCEHGCAYCYARPMHEYLGYSAGLDFETKIHVKHDAAALLRKELDAARWKPQPLALSGATDPYQPIERELRLTRACLEVLLECRNPVGIITKNHLVRRDLDLLTQLAAFDCAHVNLSVTTLDPKLAREMEPRAATPAARLETVAALAAAGVPVGVLAAPMVPGLTDHELPRIIEAAAAAGASWVGYIVLRLPRAVAPLFDAWLLRHVPLQRDKVMARVEDMRGGRRNDSRYGARMRGGGIHADQLQQLYTIACRRHGLPRPHPDLSIAHFRRPPGDQLELF